MRRRHPFAHMIAALVLMVLVWIMAVFLAF